MTRDAPPAVLVVEDDPDVAAVMVRSLDRNGYAVTHVETGSGAIAHVASQRPAVVLLDLGLPDADGVDVCRRIRADGFDGAVVVVTARASESDVALTIEAGADDFLAKPFGLAELQARVRAVVDRAGRPAAPVLGTETGLRISPASRRVVHDGVEIPLTRMEFDLLTVLLRHRGEVVPYPDVAAEAGPAAASTSTRLVQLTLRRLDDKLEAAGARERVTLVPGDGARLDVAPT